MIRSCCRVWIAVLAVTLLACETPATEEQPAQQLTSAAPDTAGVDSLLQRLAAAAQAGDPEAYATQYDERGAILPPNQPAAVGRTAVRDWAREFFGRWEVRIDAFNVEDRRIGTDVGYARYRATGTYTPKGGGASVAFDQKYVDTYVRDESGAWKMGAHMVNANTKSPSIWD